MENLDFKLKERGRTGASDPTTHAEQSINYYLGSKLLTVTINYLDGSDHLILFDYAFTLIERLKAKINFSAKRRLSFYNAHLHCRIVIEKIIIN